MNGILKGADGKICNAKICYNITLSVCLFKIVVSGMIIGTWNAGPVDYTGLAMILGAVGAVYYGRNQTKQKNNV